MAIGMIHEKRVAKLPVLLTQVLAHDSERELIFQAKNGSAAAFDRLVECYGKKLFHVARRITHHSQDAEDVVQEAFVKAFRNLAQFRGDSRFYTWMVRITVNEALMKLRRHRFNEVSIDGSIEADDALILREIQDREPNPEQLYSQKEAQRILATTISKLDRGHRTVFQLRDVEGLSTEETAHVLDLSSTAVKTRLRRARMRLQKSLIKYHWSKT